MSDTLNIEKPYMVIKKTHLVVAFVILLLGFGVQVGLGIARVDLSQRIDGVERQQAQVDKLRSEVQALGVEAGRLRVEIEGLRRDLERFGRGR